LIKAFFENDTFRSGKDFALNACVGQNGLNNIVSYELGYDKALKAVVADTLTNHTNVDLTIYPILFLARHRIELFLKRLIRPLEEMNVCLCTGTPTKAQTKVHDLKELFEYIAALSVGDRRIAELIDRLMPYVVDYYDIDLTGETFRYPEDFSGKHHLDDFSIINVSIFYERYSAMSAIMEDIGHVVDFLEEEYQQGSYLKSLPRSAIAEIAALLPNRDQWSDPSFDIVKSQIKATYKIGSKLLTEVLNFVQSHITFSGMIGIDNAVSETNSGDFGRLILILKEFRSEVQPETDRPFRGVVTLLGLDRLIPKKKAKVYTNYLEIKHKYQRRIQDEIPELTIISALSFQEVGYHRLYPEQYSKNVAYFRKSDLTWLIFDVLLNSLAVTEQISRGLRICGQSTLLRSATF
jgi:hypothetical protein